MWAIKVKAVGELPLAADRVPLGADVPTGYDFITETSPAEKVVAEDGVSLREPTAEEQAAIDNPVPEQVSRVQARVALHQAGLLDQVEAIIADPATDPVTVIAYTDATTFDRKSPTLAALASALGLTDTDLDNLFVAASQVEV